MRQCTSHYVTRQLPCYNNPFALGGGHISAEQLQFIEPLYPMDMVSTFPPIHALALGNTTHGLWKIADRGLSGSWRAGPEASQRPHNSETGQTEISPEHPSLIRDVPELVLVKIVEQLDVPSRCAFGQTCRIAFFLACADLYHRTHFAHILLSSSRT